MGPVPLAGHELRVGEALGRKNWLFAGVPKGADASAMLFSLVETAKANEIEKRREQAIPILEAIRAILDDRIDHVPPKSLLGQAMTYARNQWSRAVRYVDCGLLTPDNNAAENAIRPWPWAGRIGSSPEPPRVLTPAPCCSHWWKPPRPMRSSPKPT